MTSHKPKCTHTMSPLDMLDKQAYQRSNSIVDTESHINIMKDFALAYNQ